jgi:hypothetical protein
MFRRIFLVLVVTAAGCAAAALAAPPAGQGDAVAMSTVIDTVFWETDLATTGTLEKGAAPEGYPACPQTRDCAGGANSCKQSPGACQANGKTLDTDTGDEACQLSNGSVVRCLFGTIHIYTTKCGQCPCCSTFPACFCPLNCGERVTIGCA